MITLNYLMPTVSLLLHAHFIEPRLILHTATRISRSMSVLRRLQPFTVLFSFSAILVCFIDAQIHSFFHENMSGFERQ